MSLMSLIKKVENFKAREDFPDFRIGDTIKVHFKIAEGDKERVQAFEGVLIAQKRGPAASIRVRKVSFGDGVERVFPLASPRLEKIEIMQPGLVRRAKLYYLRDLKGKKARIKNRNEVLRKAQAAQAKA